MNLKRLLIVTLILVIFTIGAVSAADVLDDESLASDEDADIIESPGEEISLSNTEDAVIEAPNEPDKLETRFDDIKTDMHIYEEFNTKEEKNDYVATIEADDFVDGRITLLIDNVQYYSKSFSKYDETVYIYAFELNLPNNLKTGNHKVILNYQRNGFPTKTVQRTVDFDYAPVFTYLDDIAIGETNYIRYQSGVVGRTGSIAVFNMDGNNKGSYITTVAVTNAQATIPIVGTSKGEHGYWFDFNVDGRSFSRTISFTVHANSPGFKATASSKIYAGSAATVTFQGPYSGTVNVYVDGKDVKKFKYEGGKASETVSGLSLGKHQISVQYERGNYFFSKTFNVNVVKKPPVVTLKLNKAKVKKSAKKLVLKATLKLDKKAKKGLKVTFKFKGKKFKAKTNKKGVAKVTIKKKFLKKLKVGKKVKYQVSYGKKTVKRTAKVLK